MNLEVLAGLRIYAFLSSSEEKALIEGLSRYYGAKCVDKEELREATHVITRNADTETRKQLGESLDTSVEVVHPNWIYKSLEKGNIEPCVDFTLGEEAPKEKDIFSGMLFYFRNYEIATRDKYAGLILQNGGIVQEALAEDTTHIISPFLINESHLAARTATVTAYWIRDCSIAQELLATDINPIYKPIPGKLGIAGMKEIAISGFVGDERVNAKDMVRMVGATYSGTFNAKRNTHLVCKLAEGKKFEAAIEWNVPVVSIAWLGESIRNWNKQDEKIFAVLRHPIGELEAPESEEDDIVVPSGNIADTAPDPTSQSGSTKRKPRQGREAGVSGVSGVSEGIQGEGKNEAEEILPAPKRVKKTKSFAFSSSSSVRREEWELIVTQLGGDVPEDSSTEFTHLIMPDLKRTEKYLLAAATGRWILKEAYINACESAGEFVDETLYEWGSSDEERDGGKNPTPGVAKEIRIELLQGNKRLCEDWKVYVALEESEVPDWIIRTVVTAAGGEICSDVGWNGIATATHLITDEDHAFSKEEAEEIRERGLPCLSPHYVLDALSKEDVVESEYTFDPKVDVRTKRRTRTSDKSRRRK